MVQGNPNLTKILFAALIVTFVATVLIINYSNFAVYNNATIEEPYRSIFYNISNLQDDFEDVGYAAKNQSLVENILDFGATLTEGTINVFVTGLKAMGAFFDMIPLIGQILSAISVGLPALEGLFGLLILIAGIYIAMRYIQSVSNKYELP
jgi:hypothetical protein